MQLTGMQARARGILSLAVLMLGAPRSASHSNVLAPLILGGLDKAPARYVCTGSAQGCPR